MAARRRTSPIPSPAAVFAAAQVMPWRLTMLGLMAFNPTVRRRREATRMVMEKPAAAMLGLVEVQTLMARTWLDMWTSQSSWAGLPHLPLRMAEAFAAPGDRMVTANARRLMRRRRV